MSPRNKIVCNFCPNLHQVLLRLLKLKQPRCYFITPFPDCFLHGYVNLVGTADVRCSVGRRRWNALSANFLHGSIIRLSRDEQWLDFDSRPPVQRRSQAEMSFRRHMPCELSVVIRLMTWQALVEYTRNRRKSGLNLQHAVHCNYTDLIHRFRK